MCRAVGSSHGSGRDTLSQLATTENLGGAKTVFMENLVRANVAELKEVSLVESELGWMNLIVLWLREGQLLEDPIEAQKIRCLRESKAKHAHEEVHKGVCGNHIGGRVLAQKIVR
ncbi:hypothetical protein CFOL_v3_18937 [Cephalotus follicularis]|uniref:Uncharacterized protein n=1 Tax=Cephalotus follicularis TaxID=3775 RepID=A0A1Q3C5T7_CEPFO|nr:hypothetical protein CFOL_v3_18937 [Cephalotus follicularis]